MKLLKLLLTVIVKNPVDVKTKNIPVMFKGSQIQQDKKAGSAELGSPAQFLACDIQGLPRSSLFLALGLLATRCKILSK